MTKKLYLALALSLLIAASANANTVTVVADAATYLPGDTITLHVIADIDYAFIAGELYVPFDPTRVSLDTITLTLPVDPSFSCPPEPSCPALDNVAVIIWGVFGANLNPGPGGLMAIVTFTALSAGDVVFDAYTDDLVGGWVSLDHDVLPPPDIIGTTVSIVPLPAAAWLMIGGLGSLLGFRRRRESAAGVGFLP